MFNFILPCSGKALKSSSVQTKRLIGLSFYFLLVRKKFEFESNSSDKSSRCGASSRNLSSVTRLGRGCCTAVGHTPHNQKVEGSNLAGSGFFLLSFPTYLHQWSVLNQVSQGGASLTVCCESNKNGCLAVLPGAKHA